MSTWYDFLPYIKQFSKLLDPNNFSIKTFTSTTLIKEVYNTLHTSLLF